MCGRFVVFSDIEQLQQHFPIDQALSKVTPNYNVAPTQEILTIVRQEKPEPVGITALGSGTALGQGYFHWL
jgi:putative SOS response-associated peptidase YedK